MVTAPRVELKEKNIGLIINITKEIPNYYEDEFDYHNISIEDINESSIIDHIDPALKKIAEYNNKNTDKKIVNGFGFIIKPYSVKNINIVIQPMKYLKLCQNISCAVYAHPDA